MSEHAVKFLGNVANITNTSLSVANDSLQSSGKLANTSINVATKQLENISNDISTPTLGVINSGLSVLNTFLQDNKSNIASVIGAPIIIVNTVAGGTNEVLKLLLRSPLSAITERLNQYSIKLQNQRKIANQMQENATQLKLRQLEIDQAIALAELAKKLEEKKKLIEGVTGKVETNEIPTGTNGTSNIPVETNEGTVLVEPKILEAIENDIPGLEKAIEDGDKLDKKIMGGKKIRLTKKISRKGHKKSKKQNQKKRKTRKSN